MDEFLIGGNRIDRKLERDDRARPSFGRRTQRKVGAARQFAAGRRVTRRLRKARMCAHAHDRVDPMGTRDDVDGSANDGLGVGIVGRGHRNREFIAGDAAAHRARGQPPPSFAWRRQR